MNEPEDQDVDPERDRAVHLKNGGFLAYKGRELVHYRTPLDRPPFMLDLLSLRACVNPER